MLLIKRFKSATSLLRPETETKISKLSNGIQVISEPSPGHFAGVGVFLNAGSRYEPAHLRGLSHFNEKLAYKSSRNQSREEITAIFEKLGGNITTGHTRENILFQSTVFKHHLPEIMNIYANTIQSPLVTEEEIEETKHVILYEQSQQKPEQLMPELLIQTAYGQQTLGLPSKCQPDDLNEINRDKIMEYRNLFYRPTNLTIASVGADHDVMCELAEKYFGNMPKSTQPEPFRKQSLYTGGIKVIENKELEFTQVGMALQSFPFDNPDVYAVSTLQMLLGGGDSFSAGGPGKGMYSRLYTDVLNRYYWVESVSANHFCFSDSGIFTLQASVPPEIAPNILQVLRKKWKEIVSGPISEEELNRAKNQLCSSLFCQLESKLAHLEDIGRQFSLRQRRLTPSQISQLIQKVTVEDLKRVMKKMFDNGPLTFVLHGNPKSFGNIEKFIQSKLTIK